MNEDEKKKYAESMRRFHELCYRDAYPSDTISAVVVMGDVDYDTHPTIVKMKQEGYRLADANAFGTSDDGCLGEVLIFMKNTKE